jgi:hypothetical protein
MLVNVNFTLLNIKYAWICTSTSILTFTCSRLSFRTILGQDYFLKYIKFLINIYVVVKVK